MARQDNSIRGLTEELGSSRRSQTTGKCRNGKGRQALTLLEVMLAIAILGTSLAVVGELVRIGVTGSLRSRDLTRAQMYAESKLAEIATGIMPVQSMPPTPYETDPAFIYLVDVQPGLLEGILQVLLHVVNYVAQGGEPVYFELYRWIVDPEAEAMLEAENEGILDMSTQGEEASDEGL